MASIKDLDNPLLVLIMNRLCIQKLFTAGHVCVRWNAMRDMSLSERKELLLMVGNYAKRYIDESGFQIPKQSELVNENGEKIFPENEKSGAQLQIHSFPLDFARYLYAHFDKLTTLTISSQINENLSSIIHLLEQFNVQNGQLHTLKLYLNQDDPYEYNNNQIRTYHRLLSAVNSIGSLRKLTFDVNAQFVDNLSITQIDLPILANLEEFEFNSADEFFCLRDSITRYAVNNQGLRRIGIHYATDDFTWLLALPIELSSRFTHLHFRLNRYNHNPSFADVCRHFAHLTSLNINFTGHRFFTFAPLFRPLIHLPNLLSLVVDTNAITLSFSTATPNAQGIIHFELPSVKVFTIKIEDTISNHDFFYECNMNRVFPNVQVVRVIRNDAICLKCNIKIDDFIGQVDVEERCTRYMFRHFTHSQHLRMVCIKIVGDDGSQYRQWTWNEMEPFEEEDDEEEEEEEKEEDEEDDDEEDDEEEWEEEEEDENEQ